MPCFLRAVLCKKKPLPKSMAPKWGSWLKFCLSGGHLLRMLRFEVLLLFQRCFLCFANVGGDFSDGFT